MKCSRVIDDFHWNQSHRVLVVVYSRVYDTYVTWYLLRFLKRNTVFLLWSKMIIEVRFRVKLLKGRWAIFLLMRRSVQVIMLPSAFLKENTNHFDMKWMQTVLLTAVYTCYKHPAPLPSPPSSPPSILPPPSSPPSILPPIHPPPHPPPRACRVRRTPRPPPVDGRTDGRRQWRREMSAICALMCATTALSQ